MKSRYLCFPILSILLFCAPLTVLAATPDLAVQSVDATNGSYAPGDLISIDIAIQNIGNADSGGFTVTFYASTDSTINYSDFEIGSSARSALAASQMSNFTVNASFSNSIADGNYFIGAAIWPNEAPNANNTGVDNTTVILARPPGAELVLTEVIAPPGAYGPFPQGSDFKVQAKVSNTGTAASGPFSIDYYVSTDSSINVQDRLITSEYHSSLAPGEIPTRQVLVLFVVPADLAPGTYFVGGIVNFNDSNSADNVNVDLDPITVTDSDTFAINIGLNDTWHNKDIPGQGFFISVFPDTSPNRPYPVMFVGWFTYDLERPAQGVTAILGEPGHRWLTAYGPYSFHTARLEIELTQGGIFGSGVPAPTQAPYGSMKIWFNSCSEAVVDYDIPSVPVSDRIIVTRVANDRVALCEELADP